MLEKLSMLLETRSTKDWIIGALILALLLGVVRPHFARAPQGERELLVAAEPAETTAVAGEGKQAAPKGAGEVVVHVAGAVEAPGVYRLGPDARVNDAVETARPKAEADLDQLNLAQVLQDGDKILVPRKGEAAPTATANATPQRLAGDVGGGQVSLNQATKEELQTLPGIGPAKAEAILTYRQEHGGFQRVEDLKEVPGIGEKTFAQLADHIRL